MTAPADTDKPDADRLPETNLPAERDPVTVAVPRFFAKQAEDSLRRLLPPACADQLVFGTEEAPVLSVRCRGETRTFPAPVRLGETADFILRRLESPLPGPEREIALGALRFFPAEEKVETGGKTVRLTEKERDILCRLLENRGRTVSRRELLDAVWGFAAGVETHTLETHIYRLRGKIEADPARPAIILTEENGYRIGGES